MPPPSPDLMLLFLVSFCLIKAYFCNVRMQANQSDKIGYLIKLCQVA